MEYLNQKSQKHDWNKYVIHAIKVYNTNIHERTKYTPHELVFGRSARVPINSILPNDKDNESEYATALFKRIFDAQASACEIHAKIRCKQYYNRKANPQVFKKTISSIQVFKKYYVVLKKYLLKNSLKDKFDKQYKGLYQILEILRNNKVKLAISDKRKKIVNSDKLKKC